MNHFERIMLRRLILIGFIGLLTISPVLPRLWAVGEQNKPIPFDPSLDWGVILPMPPEKIDFGSNEDCLIYKDQSVSIRNCENPDQSTKWQSKEDWKVAEALSADLNCDGLQELVMLVWRPFKPWPIDSFLPYGGRIKDFHDKRGLSCHVILVGWDGEGYRELWAGSALVEPVFNLQVADLDGDDNQELVALEGTYDLPNRFGNLTVWDWSGFGFKLQQRIPGFFSEYGIVSDNQNVLILTN